LQTAAIYLTTKSLFCNHTTHQTGYNVTAVKWLTTKKQAQLSHRNCTI